MNTFTKTQWIGLYLGLTLAFILYFVPSITSLANEPRAVLAVTVFVATFWITEPILMVLTSLLPLVLLPITGGTSYNAASAAYINPIVLMFLGGFTVAFAIEKWNLHKRIALFILMKIGTTSKRILLGISIGTAFLSMWISNATTTLMMLPVALALITEVKNQKIFDETSSQSFSKALLLTVAYSASIGGLATLIGSIPNAVFAGVLSKLLNQEVSFVTWFIFAFPVTVLLLILLFILLIFSFPIAKSAKIPEEFVYRQFTQLGAFTRNEKAILIVFLMTIIFWIFREVLAIALTDASIVLISAFSLFMIPSSNNSTLLIFRDLLKLPWGVLFLFGGGLSIATAFIDSNLTGWFSEHLSKLTNYHYWIVLILFTAAVVFMTEIMSNTAISNLFIPVAISMSSVVNIEPYGLMAVVTLSSTCAFMLPVATPPNAVVFGNKYLQPNDMIKAGLKMNLLSIIVIVAAVYFWLPYIKIN